MSGILELSFLVLVLGAKGFTRTGIPWSSKRNITGKMAKVLGTLCVAAGLIGIGFAYWGSPKGGRRNLEAVGQGIVIGFLGAFLVFGDMIQERLEPELPLPDDEADPTL
jgi:hypothetical protein